MAKSMEEVYHEKMRNPSAQGLYVHIPFCHIKCRFCDFAAYPGLRAEVPRYLGALEKEMERHSGTVLDTLFVGGGTPSILEPEEIEALFRSLGRHFSFAE